MCLSNEKAGARIFCGRLLSLEQITKRGEKRTRNRFKGRWQSEDTGDRHFETGQRLRVALGVFADLLRIVIAHAENAGIVGDDLGEILYYTRFVPFCQYVPKGKRCLLQSGGAAAAERWERIRGGAVREGFARKSARQRPLPAKLRMFLTTEGV